MVTAWFKKLVDWIEDRDAVARNTPWGRIRAVLGVYLGCVLVSIPICFIWLSETPLHPILIALIGGGLAILLDLLMIFNKTEDWPSAIRKARTFVTGVFRGMGYVIVIIIFGFFLYGYIAAEHDGGDIDPQKAVDAFGGHN